MKEKIYLVFLHKIWFNHKKLHSIFKEKQNYKEVFEKINYTFLIKQWFKEKQTNLILENKKKLNKEKIHKILNNLNVDIIDFFDINYPNDLKNISNPPFLLYLRGKIDNKPKIAFVWTRNTTYYWEKVIFMLIPELSKYFTIISWWAAWCDSLSHKETIKNNWNTISVIWTWIDLNYPTYNRELYNKIVEKWWAVISIFPIWEPWNAYNFPIRNEIVAWLSKWIVIIEAAKKSWSLITAKLWLELWKDLFAIPWEITKKYSEWTNSLILNWEAKPVLSYNDILNEYNISENLVTNNTSINLDNNEKIIYNLLIEKSFIFDELLVKTNFDIWLLNQKLSIMEIKQIIKKNIDWSYQIN